MMDAKLEIKYIHQLARVVYGLHLIGNDLGELLKVSKHGKVKGMYKRIKDFCATAKEQATGAIADDLTRTYLLEDLRGEEIEAMGNIWFCAMRCKNILEIEDEIIALIKAKGVIDPIFKELGFDD